MKHDAGARYVSPPPESFDEYFGEATAIATLRERVRSGTHGRGVILHGSQGAGKRTLARLYAKAALCKEPKAGSPCDECEACWSFPAQTMGFIEVNWNEEADRRKKEIKYLLDAEKTTNFVGRVVVLMAHVDEAQRSQLDPLLKTWEKSRAEMIYVLTATDIDKVNAAARSRFFEYPLGPLNRSESRHLLEGRCRTHGVDAQDEALELIVKAAYGNPGGLARIWAEIAADGRLTLARTRDVVGLGWMEEVGSYLQSAIGGDAAAIARSENPSGVSGAEWVRRIRFFLRSLQVSVSPARLRDGATADEAVGQSRQTALREIGGELRGRSIALGVEPEELWRRLAEIWLCDDVACAGGLEMAQRQTCELLNGMKGAGVRSQRACVRT